MVRSFVHLSRVDLGFDAEGVLAFRVVLPEARYPDAEGVIAFQRLFLERLNGLPGVERAALVSCGPLEGWCRGNPLEVEGRPTVPGRPALVVALNRASTDYVATLGIEVEEGRSFETSDRNGAPVVIVNRALADLYFPDGDALGRNVREAGDTEWSTIVGVVGNTATVAITEPAPAPTLFAPHDDPRTGASPHLAMTWVVRATSAPLGLVPGVRAALGELDPDLALSDARHLERTVAESGARISFTLVLLAIAAATALLLGAVGIYGVISCSVVRRTGEIGVRLALGARPADVITMILREGGPSVAVGLLLGLLAAMAFGRFMGAILFGVEATDPATYLAVTVGLGVLAVVAGWIPARRAAALDPVSALHAD
jgi:predicted permease